MKDERIGIFGGTFSPPHLGHARALSAFLEQEKPDRMLVIPTAIPPHKQPKGDADPSQRLALCHLAFDSLGVCVSDIEIARGGKSYTVETLEQLSTHGRRLILLCGTDMFLSLDTWYKAQQIFALAEIVYARRENDAACEKLLAEKAEEYKTRFGAIIRPLAVNVLELSSSEVRDAIAQGKNTASFLHPDVGRYIEKCRLYQA
ncbi:MAG: nicotinate (nicotinamide) nucleotide adenylyltransferase [Clostridia bacterium]|nr:nicotinate (nicotinamide) nucleotide adenylyltransferase [Clostridia bacterium]